MLDAQEKQARELAQLAPYALKSRNSVGRAFPEGQDELRTCWERDRDRIVHCSAFRRLMYKTQVFVNSEGDHNRTRLSHSLEVSQVARSVGSALGLNEPLCEALALAHDIGHPPFGHRGERALNDLMEGQGGFRHNAQVLRVVDRLERRSPDYPGLNLTQEVRMSLLKHETAPDWPEELLPRTPEPYLEAQVVDLADSTAYNVHDIEDGLAVGLIDGEQLQGVVLWRRSEDLVRASHPTWDDLPEGDNLRVKRVTNELLGLCIDDLITSSAADLEVSGFEDAEQARQADKRMIHHSPEMRPFVAELHQFLYSQMYRHAHLDKLTEHARVVCSVLFECYLEDPHQLPAWYQHWVGVVGRERAIADYIAGMTDRFAEAEFARLRT